MDRLIRTLLTLACVTTMSCGAEPAEQRAPAPSPPNLFAATPAAKRRPALLGRALVVPDTVAYLGYFRPTPIGARSYGIPGETRGFRVGSFAAQEYPWTNADYRACERDGACPAGALDRGTGTPPDTWYARVTSEVAEASCRAHGGEVISAAQLAALVQGGERRVAWAAFEEDVLSRCEHPHRCPPFSGPSYDRQADVEAARGPYGHRGLMGGRADLVRAFPESYSWSLEGSAEAARSRPDIGVEEGAARASRFPATIDQLIEDPRGPVWTIEPGPAFPDSRGRFRCAFPVPQ